MKFYICTFLFISLNCFAQNTIPEVLKKYNKGKVPYITVDNLKDKTDMIIFDTREQKEYDVSHISSAVCVGYDQFDSKKIKATFKNLDTTIIVYCSLGIRSETIGAKLLKLGYKNVFNLYGGIFEWKNKGFPVVDNAGKPTENVHAYSLEWGKYLLKGNKIY